MDKNKISLLPKSALSIFINNIKSNKKLIVLENEGDAEKLKEQLELLNLGKIEIFPSWDSNAYEKISPLLNIMAKRIEVLNNANSFDFIITTFSAITQKLVPQSILQQNNFKISKSTKIDRDDLISKLIELGYNRSSLANEPGELAVRGSIVDFINSKGEGIRVDLFGNEVEAIKLFDPIEQTTLENINEITILPVSEVILNEQAISSFKYKYRQQFGIIASNDNLYEAVANGQKFPGFEHLLPLFYDSLDSYKTYFKNFQTIYFEEDLPIIGEYYKTIKENYELRKRFFKSGDIPYYPVLPEQMWLEEQEFYNYLNDNSLVLSEFNKSTAEYTKQEVISYSDFRLPEKENPFEYVKKFRKQKDSSLKIIIACDSEGSLNKMQEMLLTHEIHALRIDNFNDTKNLSSKNIALIKFPMDAGFYLKGILILAEQDILGYKIKRKKKSGNTLKAENFLKEATNLNEGELVVHKDYGIGRFLGLETLKVTENEHDCIKILYANNDKYYLPVENIDLLSRYGPDDGAELDKLGHTAWQARTAKLKNRIKMQAEEILKIAAERLTKKASIYHDHTGLFEEFCARFPYVETEDQLNAINDIVNDFSKGTPMDRLVCGDVGFGKTEVAMRAAFLTVVGSDSGPKAQVAVVVPTTLLARQHYHNFVERFRDMPIKIKMLSRLVPEKQSKLIKEELANGGVDIVIGTHALLAKTIHFHNLGLLVIDEEQHFGVKQKERLKELKSNVHVLTLTATPIPRTLNMALSGIRELSIIATPPVDRLAVKTFVLQFDPVAIREAIINEKSRGGRVFYVAPRISDLEEVYAKLQEIVPEAKIAIAHGQMNPNILDDIMNGFYDGKFDVLLSTTIVESGLDVPSANTIIIHRSDMLGLAQLYQLRGRVGRGKVRAYAYFTLPKVQVLTPNAKKRLEVMQKLDTLGAGFSVATHDMDIRGVGNLLGDEQSGHIREVGIELYQEMLKEAILELKAPAEEVAEKFTPVLNVGLSVLIPDEYVQDLHLKLGLYRRIAELKDEQELNEFYAEMVDRFGPMPETVKHLFTIIELKQLCLKTCVEKVDCGPKGVVFTFFKNNPKNPEKLISYMAKDPTNTKIRPDQKFVVMKEFKDDQQKINFIKNFLGVIS